MVSPGHGFIGGSEIFCVTPIVHFAWDHFRPSARYVAGGSEMVLPRTSFGKKQRRMHSYSARHFTAPKALVQRQNSSYTPRSLTAPGISPLLQREIYPWADSKSKPQNIPNLRSTYSKSRVVEGIIKRTKPATCCSLRALSLAATSHSPMVCHLQNFVTSIS